MASHETMSEQKPSGLLGFFLSYPTQLTLDALIFALLMVEAWYLLFQYHTLSFDANLYLWAQWLLCMTVFGSLRVFGPVLYYELICISRRRRYFLLRTGYALLLMVLLSWVYLIMLIGTNNNDTVDANRMATFADGFFTLIMCVQLAVVSIFTPAFTAGVIAQEKERHTFLFILTTHLSNREIVLGKMVSRLASLALLVLTGLPVFSALQFLGGIDPNMILAGFAVTGLTMVGLAGLSIFNSVMCRRARDAIALTYVALIGYLLVSGLTQLFLGNVMGAVAAVTIPYTEGWSNPITIHDLTNWFASGNMVSLVVQLMYDIQRGIPVQQSLPELMRNYAIFHGLIGIVLPIWATLRLRPVVLNEMYGQTQSMPLLVRLFGRPRVGQFPMIWKEILADPGLRLNWIGKLMMFFLVGASFIPILFIFYELIDRLYLNIRATRPGVGWWDDPWYQFGQSMNIWVRMVGTIAMCLTLLAVAVKAAGTVSGERDKHTLDELMTTPLSTGTILFGKWLGSVFSVRWGWLWMGLIWGLGVVTGGLSPFALPILVLAWFVYAATLTGIGLWFSCVCKTTLRSMMWTLGVTIFLSGGHWLLMAMLVYMPLAAMSVSERDFEWLLYFEFGQTPPCVMAIMAFWFPTTSQYNHPNINDEEVKMMVCSGIGLVTWAIAALMLWLVAHASFRVVTYRFPFQRKTRPDEVPDSVASSPEPQPLETLTQPAV